MDNKIKDVSYQIETKLIGSSGCYFLSIYYAFGKFCEERKIPIVNSDIVKIYEAAIENDWMESDCYVKNPGKICYYMIGNTDIVKNIFVHKEDISYKPKENEIEITRYELNTTGKTFAHFVVTRNGKVIYDPYGNSSTVAQGKPVSKRIITINL